MLPLITALEPAETEALALESTDAIVSLLEPWQVLRFRLSAHTREVSLTQVGEAA